MELGINRRNRGSSRLDSLRRIAAIGRSDDLERSLAGIHRPFTQERRLDSREAENLSAFASAVGHPKNAHGTLRSIEPQLAEISANSWCLHVDSRRFAHGELCVNRQAARCTTMYFARTDNRAVLMSFLQEFEQIWHTKAQTESFSFRPVSYALLGFLEGLSQAQNAPVLTQELLETILRSCDADSIEKVQTRLDHSHHRQSGDPPMEQLKSVESSTQVEENQNAQNGHSSNQNGPNVLNGHKIVQPVEEFQDGPLSISTENGVMSIIHAIADIVSMYASAHPDVAPKIVEFCEDQLDQLEDASRFHARANREVTPLLEQAINAYLHVFEYGFENIPSNVTWNVVSRNLSELGPKSGPLAATLARLTARLVGTDEENSSLYFDQLSNYSVRSQASVSVKAIKQFAAIFVSNFRSETSNIKSSYTLTNRLSLTEYEIAATGSKDGALEFVASLLSMIVGLVSALNRSTIVGLAASVLEQKMGSINEDVDARIVETWGLLAPKSSRSKFAGLLRQLVKIERQLNPALTRAVRSARISIARKPGRHGPAFFMHSLDLVVMNDGNENGPDVRNLSTPLAIISESPKRSSRRSSNASFSDDFGSGSSGDDFDEDSESVTTDERFIASEKPSGTGSWAWIDKQRNAWFNLAALGFTADSVTGEELRSLRQFARNSPPLVSEESANHLESDLKINPVSCRGASSAVLSIQHNSLVKHGIRLSQAVSNSPIYIIFLGATLMLEELRSYTGVISRFPHYFADAEFSQVGGDGQNHMTQIGSVLVKQYVRHWGFVSEHGLAVVATNLKESLVLACHRVEAVRSVAIDLINQIVIGIPAALCQTVSSFAMFDCLTLLGESTVNAVEDEYSPRAVFYSPTSDIRLELSDNVVIRTACRKDFERHVNEWSDVVNRVLSADLRSKLYSYLNKDNALGRGRRKASEFLSTEDASDDFVAHCVLLSRYESKVTFQGLGTVYTPANIEQIVFALKSAKNIKELQEAYSQTGPYISDKQRFHSDPPGFSLRVVRESVAAPFRMFTQEAMTSGITFWYHVSSQHPHLRGLIVSEVIGHSIQTAKKRQGSFSRANDSAEPMWTEMEYSPTNKKVLDRQESLMRKQLSPHSKLSNGFLRSCMYNTVLISPIYLPMFATLSFEWLEALSSDIASLHSLARNLRLEIIAFSINVSHFLWATQNQSSHPVNQSLASKLEQRITQAALAWYIQPCPQWSYGSSIPNQQKTLSLLQNSARHSHSRVASSTNNNSPCTAEEKLLYQLVTQDHEKSAAWYEPLGPGTIDKCATVGHSVLSTINNGSLDMEDLRTAWKVDPRLAVSSNFGWRFKSQQVPDASHEMVLSRPLAVWNYPVAIHILSEAHHSNIGSKFHFHSSKKDSAFHVSYVILYWHQVSPIESINLLLPPFCHDHATVQFALRSLQTHDIAKTFFYVPQIVQQLRHDEQGNIEEFILETAKYSQKFAHQIIWNMKANMYLDDDGTIPSPLKPKLDEVSERMISSFNDEEREFYDTEFRFFGDITSISGKLKPYIKKSKGEKKEKIDEEMRKIKVPEGAYSPSHPDGVVLDIDRDSGKPMQSHAKAPFLAKFKIKVDVEEVNDNDVSEVEKQTKELWQGAIFKVGDDCRQDVLALQIISVFRSIFNFCGLDVYVFPYKVTATEAGRGVIDVLPNSVSRDMLGREAVNGLDQWYRSKHGGPNSIEFQRARLNFVKSMAAYSVISYLIQFKDRHNGNIMYDDEGHLIHIDFGFCFDIVPGGVKFEAAPFKLTKEMARSMGGNKSLPFKWFEELCVRAFLASRVYADDICRVVEPMLESGLPCFKGHTIKRLRDRFVLNKTEAEAAKHMRSSIRKSYESSFTKGYDEFQRLTNGIPY